MKLSAGITAALASCAAAAQHAAQVHILPSTGVAAATPAVPRSVARLILLQRLAPFGKGPSVGDLPEDVDADKVVDLMNKFTLPFSVDGADNAASQLVLMLEGMTDAQIDEAAEAIAAPAFTISNPPSARANEDLFQVDFYDAGVAKKHRCPLTEVANPFQTKCWSGKSAVARYDVSKDAHVLKDLTANIDKLKRFSKNGEMDTTIVLLPAIPEDASSKSWSDKPQELRRRQAELPMASGHEAEVEADDAKETTTPAPKHPVFHASSKSIPACFDSEDACIKGTGNCTSHGICLNKYAKSDGSAGKDVCFACHCMGTKSKSGAVTHWAGASCTKKDVSVPFWLFAGFTIVMIGLLSLAIGMLFSVGEEKLPGVIGAGVAKSK